MKIPQRLYPKLKARGIACIYLFGSRSQGVARTHSDYDFGILLENPNALRAGSQGLYQEIYDLLEDVIRQKINMDIVFLDQAPLQLRYHVIRSGKVLFDQDPMRRARFEERALEEHADFEPHRKLFEKSILKMIP